MAGKGRRFTFHGCFQRKRSAKRKERAVKGFIRKVRIRGVSCFLVLKPRKRKRR